VAALAANKAQVSRARKVREDDRLSMAFSGGLSS
jgi:hypothetical protein